MSFTPDRAGRYAGAGVVSRHLLEEAALGVTRGIEMGQHRTVENPETDVDRGFVPHPRRRSGIVAALESAQRRRQDAGARAVPAVGHLVGPQQLGDQHVRAATSQPRPQHEDVAPAHPQQLREGEPSRQRRTVVEMITQVQLLGCIAEILQSRVLPLHGGAPGRGSASSQALAMINAGPGVGANRVSTTG